MKKWLKRIRGAIGMGLTWAAAWGGVSAIIGLFSGGGFSGALFGAFVLVVGFGVIGFVAGAGFSVVLGLAEGRRRFDQMSLPRFAAWGALGGLLLAALMVTSNPWNPFWGCRTATPATRMRPSWSGSTPIWLWIDRGAY